MILSGTARVHAPAPYDWLASVLSQRSTADLDVPADALAWLAQHPDAPTERFAPGALLRLAVRTVRELVGGRPAVLVVEDLHALDPASLNLIGELATTPDLPVLLLATSRPPDTAVSPQLAARTLARLSGTPKAIRQHLAPLDADEVAGLLAQVYAGQAVSDRVVEAVCARTGGNPYWLLELLAATPGGPDELARSPLPEHVRLVAPAADPAKPSRAGRPRSRVAAGAPDGPVAAGAAAELTAREAEVLSCLAEGMSNKQVAQLLGISIRTVTVHVSNLLRKTRSASRTEAALWALRHRIATPTRHDDLVAYR